MVEDLDDDSGVLRQEKIWIDEISFLGKTFNRDELPEKDSWFVERSADL